MNIDESVFTLVQLPRTLDLSSDSSSLEHSELEEVCTEESHDDPGGRPTPECLEMFPVVLHEISDLPVSEGEHRMQQQSDREEEPWDPCEVPGSKTIFTNTDQDGRNILLRFRGWTTYQSRPTQRSRR